MNPKLKGLFMQIKGLHKNIYRLYAYSRTQECLDAYRKLDEDKVRKWEKLKQAGVCDKTAQEFVGFSRASYYRARKRLQSLAKGIVPPSKKPKTFRKPQWGEAQKQLVLKLRRENPTYGKAKLAVLLKRDHGQTISESTVGRILKNLMEKGLIQKSASALRMKRKRNFRKGHAKPWSYKDHKTIVMGERVQIDHMTVTKNGLCVKHFQAWDRRSKFMHAKIYGHAKSSSAKKFLFDLVENTPFKIHSIQVDGGSEFMAEFEDACAGLGISLMVLPPKRPTYNGGVERGNRIFREEFYANSNLLADSIGGMRVELNKALNETFASGNLLTSISKNRVIKSHF
jgi:Fe2+ or Zn2+ uptake regulation protein